jgi:hypothetical protein
MLASLRVFIETRELMILRAQVVVVLLLLSTAACKKSLLVSTTKDAAADAAPKAIPVARCDQRAALGTCMDFLKLDATHRALCENTKAAYATEPCPRDQLLGSCVLPDDVLKRYYPSSKPDKVEKVDAAKAGPAEEAKKNCAMLSGSFEP